MSKFVSTKSLHIFSNLSQGSNKLSTRYPPVGGYTVCSEEKYELPLCATLAPHNLKVLSLPHTPKFAIYINQKPPHKSAAAQIKPN